MERQPGKGLARVAIMRPIISLEPANELQKAWPGDNPSLPHFGQHCGVEIVNGKVVLYLGRDMHCCFYTYLLEDTSPSPTTHTHTSWR